MFVNRRTVRIEWGDCDAAGIVFYPRYFAMFDASTHHLFEAAGWKKKELIREFAIIGTPMVDTAREISRRLELRRRHRHRDAHRGVSAIRVSTSSTRRSS